MIARGVGEGANLEGVLVFQLGQEGHLLENFGELHVISHAVFYRDGRRGGKLGGADQSGWCRFRREAGGG